jgi:hypothetical protein
MEMNVEDSSGRRGMCELTRSPSTVRGIDHHIRDVRNRRIQAPGRTWGRRSRSAELGTGELLYKLSFFCFLLCAIIYIAFVVLVASPLGKEEYADLISILDDFGFG